MKGRQRFRFHLHVGPPRPTSPEDRVVRMDGPRHCSHNEVEFAMDLEADKKVDLDGQYTDEVGNPTTAPDGASVVYSVDRPDLVNLTDNGDGSAVAAAIGPLGIATVHADSTLNGDVKSADFQLVVVAGLADRFEIVAGDVTEVTPDEAPPVP